MEPAIGQGREDEREAAGGARRPDPPAGDIFGHPELAHAIVVHRSIAVLEVELTGDELGDVGDDEGGGAAIRGSQTIGADRPVKRKPCDRLPHGAAVRMVPAMSADLRDRDA